VLIEGKKYYVSANTSSEMTLCTDSTKQTPASVTCADGTIIYPGEAGACGVDVYATLIFGECLNIWQWGGVLITIVSLYLLSRAGRKESISFSTNRHVWALFAAMMLGAVSGLYDKYIIATHDLEPLFVQSWFGVYQLTMMTLIALVVWLPRRRSEHFTWRWTIPLISIFVSAADLFYYHALADEDAMIAIVSMIRRSSVIVTFVAGAMLFRERNLASKAVDMILIIIGMILLAIGSH
jgi:drug/metabolite transporter (DMT)-like permease